MPTTPTVSERRDEMIGTKLATALHAVQSEITAVVKDAKNPFFTSTYATIESVIGNLRPVLAKHDITVTQMAVTEGDKAGVDTIISHISGESITSRLVIPYKDVRDPQKACGAITYARRYALVSAFLIPTEDDDGNTAAKPAEKKAEKPVSRKEQNDKFAEALDLIVDTTSKEKLEGEIKSKLKVITESLTKDQKDTLRTNYTEAKAKLSESNESEYVEII